MPGTGSRRSPRAPGGIRAAQHRQREHPGATTSITALPRTRNARSYMLIVSDAAMLILNVRQQATEDILDEHPGLTAEDIHESLLYAAEAVRERELPLRLTA
jgi:hypothetical protein